MGSFNKLSNINKYKFNKYYFMEKMPNKLTLIIF